MLKEKKYMLLLGIISMLLLIIPSYYTIDTNMYTNIYLYINIYICTRKNLPGVPFKDVLGAASCKHLAP